MLGHGLLDLVHRHPLLAAGQVGPQDGLGLIQAQPGDVAADPGHQGVEGPFQLADRVGETVGQELKDLAPGRGQEAAGLGQDGELALEDPQPEGPVSRLDAADQAGLEMGAQAGLHFRELGGRPVRRENHPTTILDQGDQGVEKLFLGVLLAGDEMDVVDQKKVGVPQLGLEGGGLAVLDGADKGRGEAFGGQVDHALGLAGAHGLPGQGVQKVGLPEAVGAVEEHRVEVTIRPGRHPAGDGEGELVGGARDEGLEAETLLQALLSGARQAGPGLGRFRGGTTGRGLRGGALRCGRLRRRRSGGRGRRGGGLALELHLRLQGEVAAHGVVLGPELADPPPGVTTNPIPGDTGGGHQADIAVLLPQGGLAQPGPEGGFAKFPPQDLAGLAPGFSRRPILRHAPVRHHQPVLTHSTLPSHLRRRACRIPRKSFPALPGPWSPAALFSLSRSLGKTLYEPNTSDGGGPVNGDSFRLWRIFSLTPGKPNSARRWGFHGPFRDVSGPWPVAWTGVPKRKNPAVGRGFS